MQNICTGESVPQSSGGVQLKLMSNLQLAHLTVQVCCLLLFNNVECMPVDKCCLILYRHFDLSNRERKEIDFIRVDGACGEGPGHDEVQFWWSCRHFFKETNQAP